MTMSQVRIDSICYISIPHRHIIIALHWSSCYCWWWCFHSYFCSIQAHEWLIQCCPRVLLIEERSHLMVHPCGGKDIQWSQSDCSIGESSWCMDWLLGCIDNTIYCSMVDWYHYHSWTVYITSLYTTLYFTTLLHIDWWEEQRHQLHLSKRVSESLDARIHYCSKG